MRKIFNEEFWLTALLVLVGASVLVACILSAEALVKVITDAFA